MEQSTIILLIIMVVSALGRANSVAIAVCLLLFIRLLNVGSYCFPFIEKQGVFWGLVLITTGILVPIVRGDVAINNLRDNLTSCTGVIAFLLSVFTTYLSGQGLQYLKLQGHAEVMPSLILGAIIAATFLGGVPVGPLIASGMLALITRLFLR